MDGPAEEGSIGLTEFFGVKIPAKKVVTVGSAPDLTTDVLDTIHLSQVALGGGAEEGRHVVYVEADGIKSVIGSLTLGGTEQFQIDFHVNDEIRVYHSGKSDVYITGYTTRNYIGFPGPSSSDEEDSEDEEMSESEEEADAREAAVAQLNGPVARKQKQRAAAAAARAIEAAAAAGGDEDDEESSDEEWMSGDEEDLAAAEAGVQSHRFSDLSEGDDSDEDEDSDEDAPPAAGRILRQLAEADSDEEESDEDQEDASDEEDEGPAAAVAVSKAAKRAAHTPLSAQQPPKKARTDAAPATPTFPRQGEPAYEADLVKFLKSNGPTKLAVLGSQVKRAPGLPKMKKFLGDRSAMFSVDDQNGLVSLK